MGRVGDFLYNIIEDNNGKEYTFKKVTLHDDGETMTDAKVDNKIFIKVGSEYFRRIGVVDITIFCKCDYNPDTNTGTDDTAGWLEAVSLLQPNETLYMPENCFSKITDTIALKNSTSIVGAGLSSCIWVDLTDNTKDAFTLPSDELWCGKLLNFCIYGDTGAANAAVSSNYYIDFATINIVVYGGFGNYFLMDTADPFGSLTSGIQNTQLTIIGKRPGIDNKRWKYDKVLPGPARGVYQKGFVNASDLFFDLQIVNGDGVTLNGNYSAANSSTLHCTLQGCTGTALRVINTKGGLSTRDFYGEANGEDIRLTDSSDIIFYGRTFGNVFLERSVNVEIPLLIGKVDADADSSAYVGNAQADGVPFVSNGGDGLTTYGYPKHNGVTGKWSPTVKSPYDFRNYFVNGDFSRFLPASTSGSNTPWGFDDNLCIVTKTGDGLTDTARTFASPNAIKITAKAGYGWHLVYHVDMPLDGRVGGKICLSFKYKNFGYFELTNRLDAAFANQNALDWGLQVENGFKLVRYSFLITQLMVDEGIKITFNSNNGTTYLSEIYCGFGVGSPHAFVPYASNDFQLIGNNLLVSGTGTPPDNDPIFVQRWAVGDQWIISNPAATGIIKYIAVTGGSPAVWREVGTEIRNGTTAQTADFNITGTAKAGVLESTSNGAGLAMTLPNGAAVRSGTIGGSMYFDLGNVIFRDGNGGAGGGSVNAVSYRFTVTPPDHADDTAAAAGGVAVNEVYRTGNALKIRLS